MRRVLIIGVLGLVCLLSSARSSVGQRTPDRSSIVDDLSRLADGAPTTIPEEYIAIDALRYLSEKKCDALPHILSLLMSRNCKARAVGVQILLRDGSAFDQVRSRVSKHYSSHYRNELEAEILALFNCDSAESRRRALASLASSHWSVRATSLQILCRTEYGTENAGVETISRLLLDDSVEVRLAALEYGKICNLSPRDIGALASALEAASSGPSIVHEGVLAVAARFQVSGRWGDEIAYRLLEVGNWSEVTAALDYIYASGRVEERVRELIIDFTYHSDNRISERAGRVVVEFYEQCDISPRDLLLHSPERARIACMEAIGKRRSGFVVFEPLVVSCAMDSDDDVCSSAIDCLSQNSEGAEYCALWRGIICGNRAEGVKYNAAYAYLSRVSISATQLDELLATTDATGRISVVRACADLRLPLLNESVQLKEMAKGLGREKAVAEEYMDKFGAR
jgi:hypothetical protein